MNKLAGIDTLLVPYKGTPLAVNDLIGGTIDFTFVDTNNALAQVKGGELRALAVTSPKRSLVTPDWPTMAERMPGFDVTAWFALLGPAKLPANVVEKMNATLIQILGQAGIKGKLMSAGNEPLILEHQKLGDFIPSEVA